MDERNSYSVNEWKETAGVWMGNNIKQLQCEWVKIVFIPVWMRENSVYSSVNERKYCLIQCEWVKIVFIPVWMSKNSVYSSVNE